MKANPNRKCRLCGESDKPFNANRLGICEPCHNVLFGVGSSTPDDKAVIAALATRLGSMAKKAELGQTDIPCEGRTKSGFKCSSGATKIRDGKHVCASHFKQLDDPFWENVPLGFDVDLRPAKAPQSLPVSNSYTAAFTIQEFCEWARCGRSTFYKEKEEGRLKTRKLGKKVVILKSDAEAWLNALPEA